MAHRIDNTLIAKIGDIVVLIAFGYLYIKNPLEKDYNLALVTLILFVARFIVSVVFKDKKLHGEIGCSILTIIFIVAYFLLK